MIVMGLMSADWPESEVATIPGSNPGAPASVNRLDSRDLLSRTGR